MRNIVWLALVVACGRTETAARRAGDPQSASISWRAADKSDDDAHVVTISLVLDGRVVAHDELHQPSDMASSCRPRFESPTVSSIACPDDLVAWEASLEPGHAIVVTRIETFLDTPQQRERRHELVRISTTATSMVLALEPEHR